MNYSFCRISNNLHFFLLFIFCVWIIQISSFTYFFLLLIFVLRIFTTIRNCWPQSKSSCASYFMQNIKMNIERERERKQRRKRKGFMHLHFSSCHQITMSVRKCWEDLLSKSFLAIHHSFRILALLNILNKYVYHTSWGHTERKKKKRKNTKFKCICVK